MAKNKLNLILLISLIIISLLVTQCNNDDGGENNKPADNEQSDVSDNKDGQNNSKDDNSKEENSTLEKNSENNNTIDKNVDFKKMSKDDLKKYHAIIKTKFGNIEIRFLPKYAPNHVKNFLSLAKKGFYDGVTFHRVIPDFMIQGGDPNSKDDNPNNDGQGGPGYTIDAEFSAIPHTRGIVSMARSSDPNSAGSQFFIMHKDTTALDGQYSVFGKVVRGLDVVDKIVAVKTNDRDRPIENIKMEVEIKKMDNIDADLEDDEKLLVEDKDKFGKFADVSIEELAKYRAKISTDLGDITLEFYPDKAPNHVRNFLNLAEKGFYDGVTFHRVIPDFMIQGGDPNSKDNDPKNDGLGGPGYSINAEFNDIQHKRGILSMARSQNPNSAGSQFFIMHKDTPYLDGKYTAFGNVIEGLDVVDRIAAVKTGENDRPVDDVKMDIDIYTVK